MKIYKDLAELPDFKKAVVTIGSFDGVHLGHQKILDSLKRNAKIIGGESIVITFEPHPRSIIFPKDKSLKLITSLEEKLILFEKFGIQNVVVVPFTVAFSQISADEYIETFLVKRFKPKIIIIGYDHRFGLNRQGNIDFLKWHEKKFDFQVIEIEREDINEIRISSTKIRNFLSDGAISKANMLLGYDFFINGNVVKGFQVGTAIGFPTANIEVENNFKIIPKTGVYAVKVRHHQFQYNGMLYIGNRPTFSNDGRKSVEVHIFDFKKDIYNDTIEICFIKKLRNSIKFENKDALVHQLNIDKKNSLLALQNKQTQI